MPISKIKADMRTGQELHDNTHSFEILTRVKFLIKHSSQTGTQLKPP